jgi:hypothetical protein
MILEFKIIRIYFVFWITMVKVESLTLVAAALASLCDVQGMQLEATARRPKSWIPHNTLSGKVDKEQIEVLFVVLKTPINM